MKENSHISKQIVIGFRLYQQIKFNKYKYIYPRLRQSEIVEKILKQWDAMDEKAKLKFKNQHFDKYQTKYADDSQQNIQKYSSPPLKIQKKPEEKVRVFVEQSKQKEPEIKYIKTWQFQYFQKSHRPSIPGQQEMQLLSSNSSGFSIQIQGEDQDYQYHTFVKLYHDKLLKQHPKWSQQQFQSIINMVWRNKAKKKERTRTKKEYHIDVPDYFKHWQNRNKPVDLNQIQKMWVALPRKARSHLSGKYDALPNFKLKDFNPCILHPKVNSLQMGPNDQKQPQIDIEEQILNKKSPAELVKSLQNWK